MNVLSRILASAMSGLALLGTAGCFDGTVVGAGDERNSPGNAAEGLTDFDPCALPKPKELAALGVSAEGVPTEGPRSVSGCSFKGEEMTLTLYTSQDGTVDSFRRNGEWDRFASVEINGRTAGNAIGAETGGEGERDCTTLVDAGGGMVMFMVTPTEQPGLGDPRPVARRIATALEPRLPK